MKVLVSAILTIFGVLALPSLAPAQERSFLCKFTGGPRAGQIQDYTGHPSGPLPVGSPCTDGISSSGVIVSSGRINPGGGGSCRTPSSEEDCDKCKSDRSYDRCLEKVKSDDE
jgi:hypothetical protein